MRKLLSIFMWFSLFIAAWLAALPVHAQSSTSGWIGYNSKDVLVKPTFPISRRPRVQSVPTCPDEVSVKLQ